jgi:uncharacterized protein (TIGR02453 family)
MAKKAEPHFRPALFKFLKDLKANNDREWFAANKSRYENDLKEPLLQFIIDFAPALAKISGHFIASPKPVGGSLFRIYRDTRFGKDKSPYKTNAGAHFRHERAKDVHAPGFYLHLEPGTVFMGAGLWHPDGKALGGIRKAIDEDSTRWKRVIGAKAFKEALVREGESLKRPPRGFDAEHPLVEDLKKKDHVAVARFTQKEACSADFLSRFTKTCRAASAYMKFLTEAVGLSY